MKFIPEIYNREDAPAKMKEAADLYERRFGICFDSLTEFPLEMLFLLHRDPDRFAGFEDRVDIASRNDQTILYDISFLGEIVNNLGKSDTDRINYFETLKRVYRKLPEKPDRFLVDRDTLFIGPEREGRILAEAMGWLPADRKLTPNAKRIHYRGGLLVGLDDCIPCKQYKRCVIIDGAIASGATLLSILQKLGKDIIKFHIYSVHSTLEGLCALLRYGESTGLDIRITVGHSTIGLNKKFYAVYPHDNDIEVVGDLGDTISDIA